MDVQCEHCQTEYEFDDAKVPAQGLSVKCSQCEHVFWVSKSTRGAPAPVSSLGVAKPAAAQAATSAWQLRQPSGKLFKLDDWATLQRWVVERKVCRDDEIAKAGGQWKRLGDIPELSSFFLAVESSVPEPMRQPTGPVDWQDEAFAGSHEDPYHPRRSKGPGGWFAALFALALLGSAVALWFISPQTFDPLLGRVPTHAGHAQALRAGFVALHRDTALAVDEAVGHFQTVLAVAPHADAQAGLAQAELRRAEFLRHELAELAVRLQEGAATKADYDARQQQIDQRVQRAHALATEALVVDVESVEALLSLADYYRFVADEPKFKEMLARAQLLKPNDAALELLLGLHRLATEDGRVHAQRHFERAIATRSNFVRARLELAKVLLAAAEPSAAQAQVDAILAAVPEHVQARALAERLAQADGTDSSAAVSDQGGATNATVGDKNAPAVPSQAPSPAAQMSFGDLLARAHRLREADQSERALEFYERARELDPTDADVYTGMGYCYLDMGNSTAAVRQFQKALAINGRFSDAHMGLAEAYRSKGMKRDAVKHYRNYLDILPNGPEASVARRMLERLQ